MADDITRAKPIITAVITIAITRFPFFNSSHSSTGVSHVKTSSKIHRDRTIVKMPTAPHPINFRYSTKISILLSPFDCAPQPISADLGTAARQAWPWRPDRAPAENVLHLFLYHKESVFGASSERLPGNERPPSGTVRRRLFQNARFNHRRR